MTSPTMYVWYYKHLLMSVLIGTTQVSGRGEPRRGAAAVPHHNTTQHHTTTSRDNIMRQHLALANLTSDNTRCSSDDAQHVSVLAITLLMHHLHRLMHYGTNLGLNTWPNESKSLSFCFLFVIATYVCIFSGTDLSAGKKIIFYSKVLNKNQTVLTLRDAKADTWILFVLQKQLRTSQTMKTSWIVSSHTNTHDATVIKTTFVFFYWSAS